MRIFYSVWVGSLISILISTGCRSRSSPIPENDADLFSSYWYQGKAEISAYKLQQARYGDTHDGYTELVFVTEDFSKSKNVKLEEPRKYKADAIKVMKMNMNKEFVTGIYQYNMMNSVYTPVEYADHPHSLKVTSGVQDWCGQTYMQANWKGHRYEVFRFSYFESEGDSTFSIVNAWLEDEVWTKIRVSPNDLPLGEIRMVPAFFYLRLNHTSVKVFDALTDLKSTSDRYVYVVDYPKLKRTLEITFEKTFPHKILGWKESYGDHEVTSAQLIKTVMTDYWNHNHPGDKSMRTELGLPAAPEAN